MNFIPKTLRLSATALLLACTVAVLAGNQRVTYNQVTKATIISSDVDYTVSSATPFTDAGAVNIVNTEHAVLILSKVKPSEAIGLLADHVKINGETAVNGQNCQVKMYNQGCIVLPYGNDFQPLTVFSDQNFSGEQCSDFGLEDTNGFMNTLSDDQLNNRIRSFTLKRGYMVTFSIRAGGYGYSRCFIAASEDLKMASLPKILDQKISSYRIFKWNDASKKGIADAADDKAICDALNVTSTYEWWRGRTDGLEPDVECVTHHYKENWPAPGDCGKGSDSPHMKTNNEPRNPSDEGQCDLNAILANWEALMATGKRLCSPSSWDGSDSWNGTGFIKEFIDAIDERGWRCDIIDMHCYWPKANFGNLENWYNSCGHRPIWVSEFVWGASWGTNTGALGAFADGVTPQQNADAVRDICQQMNGMDYVERYYYWNAERSISKVYENGTLTKAGEYYSTQNPGLAYKGKTNYIPATPPMYAPTKMSAVTSAGKASLRWYESNGELNQSMTLEWSSDGNSWQTVATIDQQEDPGYYTYEPDGAGKYRVHIVDMYGKDLYSDVISLSDTSSYYLYNIGAQQWLTCGNNWGTHASVTPNGGYDVVLAEARNGKYTIDTQLVNGDMHYLNALDNGPWMDQTPGQWTFNETGTTEEGKPLYLLTCNGQNLAYDGSSSSLVMNSETGKNAQWIMQTRDDRLAMLKEASIDNPVDATFLIAAHHFDEYDLRKSTWQGLVSNNFGGVKENINTNFCAEKFNTAFDVYQTVSDAPKGNYRLQAQAFYRNGGYADAAAKHNAGSEALNALLYIGDYTTPVQSIFTEAGKLDEGVTTSGINGKFPNNMREAALFFMNGLYENTIEFTLEYEGDFNVGIRKDMTEANDWAIFDNFRLVYLGDPMATGISTTQDNEGGMTNSHAVYDLQGRRMGSQIHNSQLKKGLYIVNGKKVVIK